MSREPSGLLSRFKSSARGQSTREHQTIMTVVLLLIAFGAVMIFSATSARNLMSGGGVGPGMLLRTVFFGVIPGLIVMFLAQRGTYPGAWQLSKRGKALDWIWPVHLPAVRGGEGSAGLIRCVAGD